MDQRTPLGCVALLDDAFNRKDIEAVLGFYEDGATIVAEPGRIVRGKAALRQFFEKIIGLGWSAAQIKTHVVETTDLALFTSKWRLSGTRPDDNKLPRDSIASTVLRRQHDGRWLVAIDNPFGPEVLK